MIPLGKTLGEPIATYHGAEAISHTKLEVFRRRPALYKKRFIDRTVEREETAALVVGSALHCAVLEPGAYAHRYAIRPDGIDRRTKDGKAQWEAFCQAHAGKTILDGDDAKLVENMASAIAGNPSAALLLSGGEAEVTWRARASKLPHPLQCRTDYFNRNGCELSEGRPYVADVKSVETLDGEEFRNFSRAFVNFGYHRQCGFYLPLLQDCDVTCWDFFFIVVEKCEPFGCVVYRPTEDAVSRGMDETVTDLGRLADCYARNDWPNLPTGVESIDLPVWYKGKEAA
jgi:hypothetical protein